MSTVVVPNLFESIDSLQVDLAPALARWLKTARFEPASIAFYELIMQLFGYPQASYNVAQLRAVQDGLAADKLWLCADPLALAIDVAHIYSIGNAYLALTRDEAEAYAAYLNASLPDGIELYVADSLRWYLSLQTPCHEDTYEPSAILGKTLVDKMPKGTLRQLYNEIQMLLHTCDLNQARRRADKPTIDALWLWGSGEQVQPQSSCAWQHVVSNDPIVYALAALNGVPNNEWSETPLEKARGVAGQLLVDARFQCVDLAEFSYRHFSQGAVRFLETLYPGHGRSYARQNWLRRMFKM
ncbi:MAG: hypothetical protein COB66_00145 [Coxiella sp. (in: Bacteria)]|nr:MAG: hypothetical protein COB66_00145 [Coxiella sp. (in: g-proteobacteria)]